MNQNHIAIVGNGYIGSVEYFLFKDHYNVIAYDTEVSRCSMKEENGEKIPIGKEDVNKCKLAIICVPTKINSNNSPNLDLVKSVLSWLETDLILIKSSIPPGYTKKLENEFKKKIVFSPEFVGTTNYGSTKSIFYKNADLRDFPFFIFGGDPSLTTKLVDIYQKVLGPEKKYIQCEHETAELVKFTTNCYFTMKLVTFGKFAKKCKEKGVDYNKIREIFLDETQESRWHTSVFKEDPFESTERSSYYSGICLPKDIRILDFVMKNNRIDSCLSQFFN